MHPKRNKVVVAMSGGVDSSMAAAVLKQQGYDVVGVTLRLPEYGDAPAEGGCCGREGAEDARRVAVKLGIPFYVLNFREKFEQTVIADFCDQYRRGLTPNPCIRCNDWIKFGHLLNKAQALGADRLATGHYVRRTRNEKSGHWELRTAMSAEDDQSYFLHCLSQTQLAHALFPLGEYSKTRVRELARQLDLSVHDKPGSQDLCFLPKGGYREFLAARRPEALRPGPIMHVSGEVLGRHQGIAAYTVGQRRGLGVAHERPLYVLSVDARTNTVTVGEREHALRTEMLCSEVNWVSIEEPDGAVRCSVKIRYNHPGADATVEALGDSSVRVRFDVPQESPAPGQTAVFYRDDLVVGGGMIQPFELAGLPGESEIRIRAVPGAGGGERCTARR